MNILNMNLFELRQHIEQNVTVLGLLVQTFGMTLIFFCLRALIFRK